VTGGAGSRAAAREPGYALLWRGRPLARGGLTWGGPGRSLWRY
jgi:hypothetical protein